MHIESIEGWLPDLKQFVKKLKDHSTLSSEER